MSITENAMVLNLQIGQWAGYKLDKDASKAITQASSADDDAARVNKHLVPKDALKPIVSAAGAIRTHFYEHTLPWKDNGDRLLTRAMYFTFMGEHDRLVDKFTAAVDQFVKVDYPKAIEQAGFRMGALFKPDDYPRPDEVGRRFYANLDVDAVTEAGDFRVELDEAQLTRIRSRLEQSVQQRINDAMADVWGRLLAVVEHFATRMQDTEAVFRNTTVTKLEEIVDLLPGLNVTGDETLEKLRQEVRDKLVGHDPKELRKKPEVRAQAAQDAQEIVERMRGFMTAFGAMNEGVD